MDDKTYKLLADAFFVLSKDLDRTAQALQDKNLTAIRADMMWQRLNVEALPNWPMLRPTYGALHEITNHIFSKYSSHKTSYDELYKNILWGLALLINKKIQTDAKISKIEAEKVINKAVDKLKKDKTYLAYAFPVVLPPLKGDISFAIGRVRFKQKKYIMKFMTEKMEQNKSLVNVKSVGSEKEKSDFLEEEFKEFKNSYKNHEWFAIIQIENISTSKAAEYARDVIEFSIILLKILAGSGHNHKLRIDDALGLRGTTWFLQQKPNGSINLNWRREWDSDSWPKDWIAVFGQEAGHFWDVYASLVNLYLDDDIHNPLLKRVVSALKLYDEACKNIKNEHKAIFFAATLESLFNYGEKNTQNISKRIAKLTYVATKGSKIASEVNVFEEVKKLYTFRSNILHGRHNWNKPHQSPISAWEDIVKFALMNALSAYSKYVCKGDSLTQRELMNDVPKYFEDQIDRWLKQRETP